MATTCSNLYSLPEDCVSTILSYTSPLDACRFSMISKNLRSIADSDMVWISFLPSDYHDIFSRALMMNPFTLMSSSSHNNKHLFYALCNPLLLDGGKMSFKLDKYTGKKSYILSAKELSIAWSNDPMYWCWKPMPESRFQEVAELRTASWLEIQGKIRTKNLTPNTLYGAYLIMKVTHRGYGLDSVPSEVSIEVSNNTVQSRKAYLWQKDENNNIMHNNKDEETGVFGNRDIVIQDYNYQVFGTIPLPSERDDGWMEIEIGDFFSGECDDEVKMSVMERGYQLKGGLVLEGIEVRPKQFDFRKEGKEDRMN